MTDGDLNPSPESFDERNRRDERRYDKGGITAGKIVNWLVLILVLVAVGYLAYGAARQFFPHWWAVQVGDQVGGAHVRGLAYGFGVGALFTFIPLLLVAQARRKFFNWAWRIILVLVALILAMPNWLTLAVAVGTSSSSAAAREIQMQQAPGFLNGSAAGAVAAFVLWLIVIGTSMRLGHQRKKVRALKGRVSELEKRNFADVKASDLEHTVEPADAPSVDD